MHSVVDFLCVCSGLIFALPQTVQGETASAPSVSVGPLFDDANSDLSSAHCALQTPAAVCVLCF